MAIPAKKQKKKIKPGEGFAGEDGVLNRSAASIGMGLLYGGRLARHDILRAIQRLAENFHKWSPRDSRKLHRLIEYVNSTLDYKQYGFIGDTWDKIALELFVDSDLASDKSDYKSTSGGFLVLIGPNTFYPILGMCQKQGCVSPSTPEAEIVAMFTALKEKVIPALDLWDKFFLDWRIL